MKIIDYTHETYNQTILYDYINSFYKSVDDGNINIKKEPRLLFFDIETTGLSAKNSTLYLIGALWYENNIINIRQWFNEDGYTENELITSFDEFCSQFTHLINFNGITFDVPYIREKAQKHSLSVDNLDKLIQIDIYKEIRSYKKILGLDNMKQVSIEKFLEIQRDDTYSGGELINVYQRYIARPDTEKEHLLLLHNHDDLLGMPGVSNILRYKALLENPDFEITDIKTNDDEQKLIINLHLSNSCSIPKRLIHTNRSGIFLNVLDDSAMILIPIIHEHLKHYFNDYRNYYYLPKEDMAIHKSVAAYVEPENRECATKTNCYVIKEDSYILCPDNTYVEIFQKNYKDKILFRTCDSLLNDNNENQIRYIKQLLSSFI